jgi:hypothetical protein
MKLKMIIAAFAALAAAQVAQAATAYWTGQVRYVTTVTYQQGVSCEYNYAGQTFWRTFAGTGMCPSSVEVE